MSNQISQFFKSVDFYNERFHNIFMKQNRFSLKSGQFFSISIIILMIPTFVYFGKDLSEKRNPIITTVTEELVLTPTVKFIDFDFFAALFLESRTGRNGQMQNISKYYRFNGIWQPSNYQKVIRFVFEPCNFSELHSQPELKNHNIFGKYQGFCPPKDIWKQIVLGGKTNTKLFISFSRCNTTVTGYPCASEDEIDAFENDVYLWVLYKGYPFDPKNYDIPIKQKFEVFTTTLLSGFEKTFENNFILEEVKTNKGWIFTDYSSQYKMTKEYTNNLLTKNAFIPHEGVNTFSCSIQFLDKKRVVYREYIKIQDVLAQVGGAFKALQMIGKLILILIYNFYYENSMLSCFRIVKLKKEEKICKKKIVFKKQNKSQRTSKVSNFMKSSNDIFNEINHFDENYSPNKVFIKSQIKFNKIDQETIKNLNYSLINKDVFKIRTSNTSHFYKNFAYLNESFSFLGKIKSIIPETFSKNKKYNIKNKYKLRETLIRDYENIYDSANFIKLIYEVEMIKKLLFSPSERACLEIITIPQIVIDENYTVKLKRLPLPDKHSNFDLESYFKYLDENTKKTKIEDKLHKVLIGKKI